MPFSSNSKLLLLEDEIDLREEIRDFFSYHGLEIHVVGSLKQFWQYVGTVRPELVILDRMLPDGDGLSVLNELRQAGSRCGVIMLTAKDSPQDYMQGLDGLADHYLTKPVSMAQLLAVVKSVLWRVRQVGAGWELRTSGWLLTDSVGVSMELTAQEFAFIKSLASQPHQARSRHKLAEDIGKSVQIYDVRNLDALVLRLRKKATLQHLEALPIRSVHGVGYLFSSDIRLV
jgi:two-component system, OmpR family, response regulator